MNARIVNTPSDDPRDSAEPGATLDAAALARLSELDPDGSRGLIDRILAVFENSLMGALDELQAAQGPGRARTVCELAHKLKSSSASVGAKDLSAVCGSIEARLRPKIDRDPPLPVAAADLDVDSDRLSAESEAALSIVRSMLRTGPSA